MRLASLSNASGAATWALLALGAAIGIYLSGGYFLADDFVQLAQFGHWEAQGRLWDEVQRRFVASIDGVNGFWRPLTYSTFALNYVMGGADARAWLGVNLALHLANAVLVGALVDRLSSGRETRRGPTRSALFAGTLFFALASGLEAVLWIAARYDTLSTFFTLLAAWWFAGGSRGKALVAAILALMSKEAGAVALVMVGFLALARELRAVGATPQTVARGLAASLWPFVAVGIAYVALRVAIFGNATHAYVGVSIDLTDARHWRTLAESGVDWARVIFPGPAGLRTLAALAAAGLLATGIAAAWRSAARVLPMAAILASFATSLALMLRFLPYFDPSGIGGRLFYAPGALLAVALGLSLQAALASPKPIADRVACALAGILVALHLPWSWRAAADYREAQLEMRAVASAIAQVAATSPSPPALLIIPDSMGRAPFGRNAQAGLMLPPVQRAPLTARVLVQADNEIGQLPGKVSRGLFDWLTRHGLFEYPGDQAALPGARDLEPSAYSCWNSMEDRFARMSLQPGERPTLAERIDQAHDLAGCQPQRRGAPQKRGRPRRPQLSAPTARSREA